MTKGDITFKDFQKLDIRVGTVVSAEVPKWSHWVMKLTVDLGGSPAGGGKKTVFAGIKKYYKPKDLVGKQVVVVTNLEPKKIGPEGDYSEAMVLAASVPSKSGKEEDQRPVLLCVSDKVPNGTKVR
jgi:methionine--tRNA ligase beta chain